MCSSDMSIDSDDVDDDLRTFNQEDEEPGHFLNESTADFNKEIRQIN